jgi:hypothetical protein
MHAAIRIRHQLLRQLEPPGGQPASSAATAPPRGDWLTAPWIGEPLDLPESVRAVVVHDIVIVTTGGADIAAYQPALLQAPR